jgi:hypothetical protein
MKVLIQQLAVGLAGASTVLAAFAGAFAFRADRAARGARAESERRWDDLLRPRPSFSFTTAPPTGRPVEVDVENLGGVLAAGAVIAEYGDELYACELSLPDKAAPRRIQMAPVMKAWQKVKQPSILMVACRDVSGRWWDCLNGATVIKDPSRWVDATLKDLRLQGVVSFPELSSLPPPKR